MGFKGYRLWVMGQLDSNVCRAPPRVSRHRECQTALASVGAGIDAACVAAGVVGDGEVAAVAPVPPARRSVIRLRVVAPPVAEEIRSPRRAVALQVVYLKGKL
jgi:hypothetical protein